MNVLLYVIYLFSQIASQSNIKRTETLRFKLTALPSCCLWIVLYTYLLPLSCKKNKKNNALLIALSQLACKLLRILG